jgi:hypothetical protein
MSHVTFGHSNILYHNYWPKNNIYELTENIDKKS